MLSRLQKVNSLFADQPQLFNNAVRPFAITNLSALKWVFGLEDEVPLVRVAKQ
jgi:uncharacterized protein VirK/YbjX